MFVTPRIELHDQLCGFYRRTSGPARRSTRGQWTAEEVKFMFPSASSYKFLSNPMFM